MFPAFLQFWCNVFHCKSAYKNRLHCYLCSLAEFCILSEIHVFKTQFKQTNEDLRLNVYAMHTCSGNLCTKFIALAS